MVDKMMFKGVDQVVGLIESIGTIVTTSNGTKYYFLPFWLEDKGDGIYLTHRLGNLPKDLENYIKLERNGNEEEDMQGSQERSGEAT